LRTWHQASIQPVRWTQNNGVRDLGFDGGMRAACGAESRGAAGSEP
jgi:hypothetical protein